MPPRYLIERYNHLRYEAIVGHFFSGLFSVIYLFQLLCEDYVLNNIIRIIHSVSDCTTSGIIPSLFLIFIILLLYIKQTVYCEYESDLRSNEHYLSSSEKKA